MTFLDLAFSSPAANLAGDEALLDWREEQGGEDILRFWESPEPFVVVGYANKIQAEVDSLRCDADGVPILRRCSGGGTVLQGPGCLNYALILGMTRTPALSTISKANQFIMERNCAAIRSVAGDSIIEIQGHTDLAIQTPGIGREKSQGPVASEPAERGEGFRKFSGNSQRRHKNFLLFHGTFLVDFDLALISRYLKFPSKQPGYRKDRHHSDFLTNLHLPVTAIKAALCQAWAAGQPLSNPPLGRIQELAREKYERPDWNRKFFDL